MKNNKILIGLVVVLFIGLIAEGLYMVKLHRKIKSLESPFSFENRFSDPFLRHKSFFWGKYPRFDSFGDFDSFFDKNWDPFREMEKMRRRIDKMFKESFSRLAPYKNMPFYQHGSFFSPDIDIKENRNGYVITMDIPGMDKSKIDIEVKGNNLVVSGERKEETEENTQKGKSIFYKKERSFGYFSRVIPLPDDAKKDEIKADYKKGVLRIIIPKDTTKTNSVGAKKVNIL